MTDVAQAYDLSTIDELKLIEKLEVNPILSAFLSGQIEQTKTEKKFSSNIFPSLQIASDLKMKMKKKKLNKLRENQIVSQAIRLNQSIDKQIAGYNFNAIIISNKGVNSVLSLSVDYSTEETVDSDYSVFISVGLEAVELKKDLTLLTKIYRHYLKL